MAAVVPSDDLGLEATAEVAGTGKQTSVRVGVAVGSTPGVVLPPRDVLEVLGIIVDTTGKTVAKAGARTEVAATGGALNPPAFVLEPLKPGRYQVRVAVRSVALDRTGSVFLDVHIPPP